ncbi:MIRO family protein [Selaginella moellendorffii]|uniref:Mitochondrial Rho GTPase n=1 Tax=Selaginella moellendorffii TaxID=88036 RepID=D8RQC7_SELML|nr:mitochondrial Rho GTPase 1 [Selaginella moellendorffii]EFJ25633.1 MIRO family protein [Selaginella moellendorffii]|eukprot:XP_002973259.1 mitochondrial Rho GTPase 1 [Selaginella moellendorffii]
MAASGISNVRVVVVGDPGTGKSSLIVAAAAESFPDKAPPVLLPTKLPPDFLPDRVPLTIIDTPSRPEDRELVEQECKKADTIVLTYACDQPSTLESIQTYWLPELRALEVKVPIIVVGCKLDLRQDKEPMLEQVMAPIMHDFREIETCIECSALKRIQVLEVFYYAQKAVLHPTAPLFDQETQSLKPKCIRALKRIFILCDHDRDGALNDSELNDFQVRCFHAPLQPPEIVGVKKVVSEKMPEGVSENGLTLTGFLFLHALFIERGRLETTWTVLRKYGYDDELKLREDLLQNPSFKRAPDQSVELTERCLDFLKGVFAAFDMDGDGALRPQEIEELFSTAPSNPWEEDLSEGSVEVNAMGGVTLNGFLSQWSLMTLLDPVKSLGHLIYIGYPADLTSAFRITRRRRLDRKKQRSQRTIFQCYVFGPRGAGKSALLNALIGRPFADTSRSTEEDRFSANIVEQTRGTKKTLVLREIPEEQVANLMQTKDALAPCDVAAFVYDSSDDASWERASEILVKVTALGEHSGYEVPCLLIAAKDDLEPDPLAIQNSARVCTDMGVEAPIAVSMRLGDIGNLFRRIVDAAERPHLSIPETEAGKSHKSFNRIVNRSLTITAVGAALVFFGIAAYKTYEYRRRSSSS